jgi:1-acyl-sn-glycerol-3-phosphate acyltransferase
MSEAIIVPKRKKYNLFTLFFARIWAIWGVLTFAITFLIIFIPSMATKLVKDPKGMWWFILVSKAWNATWLYLILSPLKVYGKEHFKKGNTYIVTANHNAMLDVPLLCPFVPGPNQTIAKDSFMQEVPY